MISTDLLLEFTAVVMHEDANDIEHPDVVLWNFVESMDESQAGRLVRTLHEVATMRAADRDELLQSIGFAWSLDGGEGEFFAALAEAVEAMTEEIALGET